MKKFVPLLGFFRTHVWRLVRFVHWIDYAYLLPAIAKLPLVLGFRFSNLRGRINAAVGRDWRSVALGFRHIRQQSRLGYRSLPREAEDSMIEAWIKERFAAEARDEFEARLISGRRVEELECDFIPTVASTVCAKMAGKRGLVLLTPHFESFFLGVAFLARSGAVVNLMSSAVSHDPRVDHAVQSHFEQKYRGLERYLNGGKVVDMELGLRNFYRMLERRETLVVLGDAPVLPKGAEMLVNFLGGERSLAGGALRMAKLTKSDLGGFVCRCVGVGRYQLEMCALGSASDPLTIDQIYQFFTEKIMDQPGGWWAADLLPHMPLTNKTSDASTHH
jgi:lauroyl/myristoyl acyltransferase